MGVALMGTRGAGVQVNALNGSVGALPLTASKRARVGVRAEPTEPAELLQQAAEPSGSFLEIANAQLKVLCNSGTASAATLVLRTVASFNPGSPLTFYTAGSCPPGSRLHDDRHELSVDAANTSDTDEDTCVGSGNDSFGTASAFSNLSRSAEEVLVQQGGLTLPASGAYVRALSSASLLIGLLIVEPPQTLPSNDSSSPTVVDSVCDTLSRAYLLDQHSSLQRRITDRREQQLWKVSTLLKEPVDAVKGMTSMLQKQLDRHTPQRDLANALATQGSDLTDAASELESLLFTPRTFRIPELPTDISQGMMGRERAAASERQQESERVRRQHRDRAEPAGVRPLSEGVSCDVATELASIIGSSEGVASQIGVNLVARGVPERGARSFAADRDCVRSVLSNAFENVLGRAQRGENVAIDVLSTKSGVGIFVTLRAEDGERDAASSSRTRRPSLPWEQSDLEDPGSTQSAKISRKEAERAGGLATFNSNGAEVWLPQPAKERKRKTSPAAAEPLPQ